MDGELVYGIFFWRTPIFARSVDPGNIHNGDRRNVGNLLLSLRSSLQPFPKLLLNLSGKPKRTFTPFRVKDGRTNDEELGSFLVGFSASFPAPCEGRPPKSNTKMQNSAMPSRIATGREETAWNPCQINANEPSYEETDIPPTTFALVPAVLIEMAQGSSGWFSEVEPRTF